MRPLLLISLLLVGACTPLTETRWSWGHRTRKPKVTRDDTSNGYLVAKKRGAEALSCPPLEVAVESRGDNAYRVHGCDAVATVVCMEGASISCVVERVDGPQ